MFAPHGPQPPSVYWRRRVTLLASIVVLIAVIAITVRVVFADQGSTATATGSSPAALPPSSAHSTRHAPQSSAHRSASPRRITAAQAATAPATAAPTTSESARTCQPAQLKVTAVTNRSTYPVGAAPVLTMQVSNTWAAACIQDLADQQVLLRVYNGESRVWGSHDCKTLPGSDERVLSPNAPIRISVVWSGLSSQAHCAGIRQRVGIGTYTLYASLAGKVGEAAQFSIA